jgi:hypothetical protein
MRLQQLLKQVQQMEVNDLLALFGNDSRLSFMELRNRANQEQWAGNDFNKNLLTAKNQGYLTEIIEDFMGYFYEKDPMLTN